MRTINKYLVFSLMVLMGAVFTACEDHQERFQEPSWLGGSSLDILEENEDYSIYLDLLKKSGIVEKVSVISYTLFVPDNAAFEKYFQENGIAGVDAMTETEAYQLMSLHLLANPRSRYDLIYELVFGSDASQRETESSEYNSLFFKKKTEYIEPTYKDLPKYDDTLQDSVVIRPNDVKYVPVWSVEYFNDIFAKDPEGDYEFMYQPWSSDFDTESAIADKAMNINNAKFLADPDHPELFGVKTSSGFIYPIDQVIVPMPSIEKYMATHQKDVSVFYNLMQRFARYGSKTYVDVEIDGETVSQEQYIKSYTNSVPNIASEYGPRSDYGGAFKAIYLYSAFIPENDAMEQYLNDEIIPVFGHIDSVPDITLSYLIRSHLNNDLVLKSKALDGFFDNFGTPRTLVDADFKEAQMCSNGPLYKMNNVLVPNAFTSISHDLFFNKDYSTFLYILDQNGLVSSLATAGDKATVFAPTNDELQLAGIRYNALEERMEFYGINEKWNVMSDADQKEFAENHITFNKIDNLSGEGFIRMNSSNYIYYNNGVIQGPENQFLGTQGVTSVVKETEDGFMYHTTVPIMSRNYSVAKLLHNDLDEKYAETLTDTTLTMFSDLLYDARLLNYRGRDPITREYVPTINFLTNANAWTVFAPTNEAIRKAQAEGLIPEDRDSLKNWAYYHFVPDRVIFDNGEISGTFDTQLEGEPIGEVTTYETLQFNNSVNHLQLVDKTGQVVNVAHSDANMLAQQAVVHKINTVLKAW